MKIHEKIIGLHVLTDRELPYPRSLLKIMESAISGGARDKHEMTSWARRQSYRRERLSRFFSTDQDKLLIAFRAENRAWNSIDNSPG